MGEGGGGEGTPKTASGGKGEGKKGREGENIGEQVDGGMAGGNDEKKGEK